MLFRSGLLGKSNIRALKCAPPTGKLTGGVGNARREREEVGGWMAWEKKKVISGERKRADGRRVDFWRNIVDLDDRRNCGVGESGYTKKCN